MLFGEEIQTASRRQWIRTCAVVARLAIFAVGLLAFGALAVLYAETGGAFPTFAEPQTPALIGPHVIHETASVTLIATAAALALVEVVRLSRSRADADNLWSWRRVIGLGTACLLLIGKDVLVPGLEPPGASLFAWSVNLVAALLYGVSGFAAAVGPRPTRHAPDPHRRAED